MRFAVISTAIDAPLVAGAVVENTIVAAPEQLDELQPAIGKRMLDTAPLGLEIGDLYNGVAWTRNVDGEQVVLPIDPVGEALRVLQDLLGTNHTDDTQGGTEDDNTAVDG